MTEVSKAGQYIALTEMDIGNIRNKGVEKACQDVAAIFGVSSKIASAEVAWDATRAFEWAKRLAIVEGKILEKAGVASMNLVSPKNFDKGMLSEPDKERAALAGRQLIRRALIEIQMVVNNKAITPEELALFCCGEERLDVFEDKMKKLYDQASDESEKNAINSAANMVTQPMLGAQHAAQVLGILEY